MENATICSSLRVSLDSETPVIALIRSSPGAPLHGQAGEVLAQLGDRGQAIAPAEPAFALGQGQGPAPETGVMALRNAHHAGDHRDGQRRRDRLHEIDLLACWDARSELAR